MASDPGLQYPKWMVLQLDTAEDPRSKILHPERYADGGPGKDLRRTGWSGESHQTVWADVVCCPGPVCR